MKKCNIDRSHYLFDNQALVSLIVPLIIEQLLTVLVGMADSIMVANVGEAAVSGVSLVDQIMVLLINIFAALATGGAVVAGQYLGQKNKEQACKSTTQLMWSMGFISLVITAVVGTDTSGPIGSAFQTLVKNFIDQANKNTGLPTP